MCQRSECARSEGTKSLSVLPTASSRRLSHAPPNCGHPLQSAHSLVFRDEPQKPGTPPSIDMCGASLQYCDRSQAPSGQTDVPCSGLLVCTGHASDFSPLRAERRMPSRRSGGWRRSMTHWSGLWPRTLIPLRWAGAPSTPRATLATTSGSPTGSFKASPHCPCLGCVHCTAFE